MADDQPRHGNRQPDEAPPKTGALETMGYEGLYNKALKKPWLLISGAAMFGGLFPLVKAANIGLKMDQLGPFMIGGSILGAAVGTYLFLRSKIENKFFKFMFGCLGVLLVIAAIIWVGLTFQ